jgi:hypothetical protein
MRRTLSVRHNVTCASANTLSHVLLFVTSHIFCYVSIMIGLSKVYNNLIENNKCSNPRSLAEI